MHKKAKARISVIGLGYIGLPTAALLADKGYVVTGVDTNRNVVNCINNGEVHIPEPGLQEYVSSAIRKVTLFCATDVAAAEIYIICVPTPLRDNNGERIPNTDFVMAAASHIAPKLKNGDMVILESTSPVGTTEAVRDILIRKSGKSISEIYVAYCPERVLPGNTMTEIVENDRVIGGVEEQSTAKVAEFYRSFVKGEVLETDARTAEMCKLVENSFRDLNIAFANELSILCSKTGVDVWNLIKIANRHPRVNILQPGAGVGGHCIAVDPWFIVAAEPEAAKLIATARRVNDEKPRWVAEALIAEARRLGLKKVACLGLTFKPDIDDLRESPACTIVDLLSEHGLEVYCVEPNISDHPEYKLVGLHEALDNIELIAVLVGHRQFKTQATKKKLRRKVTLDFCGALFN